MNTTLSASRCIVEKPVIPSARERLTVVPDMRQPERRLLEVSPMTPCIGGMDLSRSISEDHAEELRQVLLDGKVTPSVADTTSTRSPIRRCSRTLSPARTTRAVHGSTKIHLLNIGHALSCG
jgi:hypothetical protein